jgi:DNA-directed RNA polymerase subunit beta'
MAYEQGEIDIHASVWVRFEGILEGQGEEKDDEEPKVTVLEDGTKVKEFEFRRIREDVEGGLISQYIKTTPGRVIFNQAIYASLAS